MSTRDFSIFLRCTQRWQLAMVWRWSLRHLQRIEWADCDPYSPISTMSWIGACAEGNDDDPLLPSSLQMIWRQTACSTIAWLAGLECTGSASAVSSDAHRSTA